MSESHAGDGRAKPVHILHVDDNEANRYAVSRSLRQAGFEVDEATTGREALEKVAAGPDLVILDIRLPDIDGYEVCQRIKTDPATHSIPVLHLSASLVTSQDKAYGLEAGADGYLIRPVEPVELIATVNALLRQRRTEEALRRSERWFRQLADAMPQMVWSARPDGQIDYYNERWYEFTGFDRAWDVGAGWDPIAHPDDLPAARERWKRALANAEQYQVECRFHARNTGDYHWHLVRAVPVRDEGGAVIKWFGTCTDIHDQKMSEEQLRRASEEAEAAREAAEQANRLKDDFLATLSHELRTPLNAIVGWASILHGAKIGNEDLAEGLEAIERNAKVQAQLIEDLLDVSRIMSGKLRLDVQEVDLESIISAALESVRPAAMNKGVRLHKILDPQAAIVWGDPARLQQVVWNLLSNAIKFTPKDGRVQVALARVHSHVEVSIGDTGQGIPARFLPHVFERFRQADATTTRKFGGLGLGLAIVKHLVELHGGTVMAESDGEGRGSKFTIRLPLTVIERKPDSPKGGPPRKEVGESINCPQPDIAGTRVLVVDDEPDARALMRRVIEECKGVVTTAASAAEALECLGRSQFDAIVSDIGMSQSDGYDLIRQIRALPPEAGGRTPAVALTAFARSEDRRRALLAGFQLHVSKPVDPSELLAVIASVIGRTQKQ